MTQLHNNTLVHSYLVPLIENIDFTECTNPTQIKSIISKLLTVAKKSFKAHNNPDDMSVLDNIELSPCSVIKTATSPTKGSDDDIVLSTNPTSTIIFVDAKKGPKKGSKKQAADTEDDVVKKVDKKTATKAEKADKADKTEKKKPVKKLVVKKEISQPKDSEESDEESDEDKEDSAVDDDDDDSQKKAIKETTSILKKMLVKDPAAATASDNSDMEDPVSDDE
jgi:hypothetical protein